MMSWIENTGRSGRGREERTVHLQVVVEPQAGLEGEEKECWDGEEMFEGEGTENTSYYTLRQGFDEG